MQNLLKHYLICKSINSLRSLHYIYGNGAAANMFLVYRTFHICVRQFVYICIYMYIYAYIALVADNSNIA